MAAPVISTLPTPPSRSSPSDFSQKADAFLGALPTFQSQLNSFGTYVDTTVKGYSDAAARSAGAAATSKTGADSAKTAAAASGGQAKTSETNAKTSETNAKASENAALLSKGAAETAAGTATARFTDFNQKFYGARATPPTGNITEGALYFDTGAKSLRIYTAGSWVGAVASSAEELFTLLKQSYDGHNSNLDADTVDGKHASDLAPAVGQIDNPFRLGNTTNLNSITEAGFYTQNTAAGATFTNNYPTGAAGSLRVERTANESVLQEYTPHTMEGISFRRVLSVGSWSSWTSTTQFVPLNGQINASVIATTSVSTGYGVAVAGSALTVTNCKGVGSSPTTLTGTWRSEGHATVGNPCSFLRIA